MRSAWLLVLALWLSTVPVYAQTAPASPLPSGAPVIIQIGALSSPITQDLTTYVRSELELPTDVPAITVGTRDPRLLVSVGRALIASAARSQPADATPCTTTSGALVRELDQAQQAIDFLKTDQARLHLSAARNALVCGSEVADRPSIARYLFLSGVARISSPAEAEVLFQDAIGVDPTLPAPEDYPVEVRKAFARAKQNATQRAAVRARVRAENALGLRLLIDGRQANDGLIDLSPGTHLLQWQESSSRAVAGVLLALQPAASGVVVLPPAALQPQDPSEIALRLERLAVAQDNDERLMAALQRLCRSDPRPWMALAVASGPSKTRVTLITAESATVEWRKAQSVSASSRGLRRFMPWVMIGTGAATLASSGIYAYQYRTLSETLFQDATEGARVYRSAGLARAGIFVGAGGLVLSSGLYVFLPRPTVTARREPPALRLAVSATAGASEVWLEGRW